MLCCDLIFLNITGKIAVASRTATHPEVLGCRAAFPVLSIHAKVCERNCRSTVPGDVQNGLGSLQNTVQSHDMAEFYKMREHEIVSSYVQERHKRAEIQHDRKVPQASHPH